MLETFENRDTILAKYMKSYNKNLINKKNCKFEKDKKSIYQWESL